MASDRGIREYDDDGMRRSAMRAFVVIIVIIGGIP
jgi:hypothetical protein